MKVEQESIADHFMNGLIVAHGEVVFDDDAGIGA